MYFWELNKKTATKIMNIETFIKAIDQQGELITVNTPVTPNLEIAELTDRQCKSPGGGKALLFTNTGTDFPVLTNMMGSNKRINKALSVNSLNEIEHRIDSLFTKVMTPKMSIWEKLSLLPTLKEVSASMPKRKSGKGECQAIEMEVDLSKLPILTSAPHDAAPFVTLPMVHTIDPDTGSQNVGMYRMQVIDNQTTGMHWHIHKTGASHYRKYKERGEKMPVTVCLGGDPLYTFAATAPLPEGIDEYMLAGFIKRKPVELVKCLESNIYVPCDVDFVIEGYVDPTEELFYEGPFGDHTGFYSLEDYYPKFHITKITHRKNAIYPATIVGVPPMEDFYFALASERIFVEPIRKVIAPEVVDMLMPLEGVAHNIVLVSIKKSYPAQAFKVASALWGAGQMGLNKCLIILSHRDGVSLMDNFTEALKTMNPKRDCTIVNGTLDVLDHATPTIGLGGKIAIDLTEKLPIELVANSPKNDLTVRVSHENSVEQGVVKIVIDSHIPLESPMSVVTWLTGANCDPMRDITLSENSAVVDARAKISVLERHPQIVTQSKEIIEMVDKKWEQYGLGEFIESASLKYIPLLFGEGYKIKK